jgi:hypothetical protein
MLGTSDPGGITIDMAEMPLLAGQDPCPAAPAVDQSSVDGRSVFAAQLPVGGIVVDDPVVSALLHAPHTMLLPQGRGHTRRLRPRAGTPQPLVQYLLTVALAIPVMVRQDRLVTVFHPAQLHDLWLHPGTAQAHPIPQISEDEVQAAA